ncbi:HlyD family efflux transporter periplasmic adaptor subunit [Pseudidiomarina marina]|uniref:HlyD family secretion protein n=1 Tax=Pseudidiomarina marina TaxID=502366 RepID=UPI00384D3FDB
MKPATKWVLRIIVVIIAGWLAWVYFTDLTTEQPSHIASGNGRIEAVEINIAAKTPGRIVSIDVREGQFVQKGDRLATLDTGALQAQLHQAQAQYRQAQSAVIAAQSQVALRRSEKTAAEAVLVQRRAELELAKTRFARTEQLAAQGSMSQQDLDNAKAALIGAEAAIAATKAQIAAADAAIAAAETNVSGAESTVEAAQATIERLQVELSDSELLAPRDGRVQFIVARQGEVVGAGGRILNMMDLKDVYMTFFLPTAVVGKLALGSEARIVLDAAPHYVIPAKISFISDEAQFTPKTVETSLEREKLMFRVRAQISQDLLERYIEQVKTGLPGMAYVRIDTEQPWPEHLQLAGND